MSHAGGQDSRIRLVAGRALVLRGDDIDTDRIMPARFLRAVSFDGLEAHLFEDDRAATAGQGGVHPLDTMAAAAASILLVNRNFGCGSSREHAPQGIARRGIQAVVGESFAEIFFSNSTALGMPCVAAVRDDVYEVMAAVERDRQAIVTVDLSTLRVAVGQASWPVTMPESARQAFLAGTWDATALLTAQFDEVRAVAVRLPY